jgi:pimeloyl-ACP methyl ester carboxylesterase
MRPSIATLVCTCLLTTSGLMMQRIAIAQEPWRADPALVAKHSGAQKEFNYDESKVPEFTLPDPLKSADGTKISSADDWPALREQTLELFRTHVYGRRPTADYRVTFQTTAEQTGLFGDLNATGRSVSVNIVVNEESFSFPLLVFIPSDSSSNSRTSKTRFPAVVQINHQMLPSLSDAIQTEDEFWPVQTLLKRGYIACAVSAVSIDPDQPNGFEKGIRGAFHRASGSANAPAEDAWKALSAWGWGASRAVDYLLTLDSVDQSKIAVLGHSRGGKAAFWAAAEDPRFSIACSNNSGCGGAALSRRAYGETVARITKSFPHWFCDKFSSYAGKEASLPVDQHQLVGLLAPRGAYVTSASDDLWADPRGEYLSLVEAAPVYRLLGESGISNREMPSLNQPRIEGKMGYHIRPGAHGLFAYDWERFLDFCDAQWVRTSSK